MQKMPRTNRLQSIFLGMRFRRNYLEPLDELFKTYGDYVDLAGPHPVIAAFHPAAVEHVLRTNSKNYLKAPDMQELKPILGEGLLTSEGSHWREHRKLIGPEFQLKKIESFYPIMTKHLRTLLKFWKSNDQVHDVAKDLSKTTYAIAGECFFGADVGDSAESIYRHIDLASPTIIRRMVSPWKLPLAWPLPSHRQLRRSVHELNSVVYKIIQTREANPSEAQDILSRLMRMRNEAGEKHFTSEDVRDEVMTLLLAGHETTANTLSWTLYLLGLNPQIQAQAREEILAKVTDEVPTLSELRTLSYSKMVIEESMRLFPPAATIGRFNIESDELGGYPIRPNTVVNLSQWVTHRHPEFWTKPEDFHPERFAKSENIHPFAYFPFALGPRECVGKNMAVIETLAILAGLLRNFEFQLMKSDVKVKPLITIRPDPGVYMRILPLHHKAQTRTQPRPD